MKKPTDIERLFQRIGLTDVRYHEFAPEPDPVRARENWPLVDSSVQSDRDRRMPGHVPLARATPPTRRSGAFYDRVAELRERNVPERPESEVDPVAVPAHEHREETASDASLQRVFSRVRGEPVEPPRSTPPEPDKSTPLSQVFKRLS